MRLVAGWGSLAAAVVQDCEPHPKLVIAATGVFHLRLNGTSDQGGSLIFTGLQSMLEGFESSSIHESTQRLHCDTRGTSLAHLGLRAHLAQTRDCDKNV
jgi:hypothetical protein